jgi:hypothetical protein
MSHIWPYKCRDNGFPPECVSDMPLASRDPYCGAFVDVNKGYLRASLGDRFGGGYEGIRDRYDGVSFAYAGGNQGKAKSVRAAAHANSMLSATEGGEFLFEGFDFGAADEMGGAEGLADNGNELFFKLDMGCDQIKKWNVHVCPLTKKSNTEKGRTPKNTGNFLTYFQQEHCGLSVRV